MLLLMVSDVILSVFVTTWAHEARDIVRWQMRVSRMPQVNISITVIRPLGGYLGTVSLWLYFAGGQCDKKWRGWLNPFLQFPWQNHSHDPEVTRAATVVSNFPSAVENIILWLTLILGRVRVQDKISSWGAFLPSNHYQSPPQLVWSCLFGKPDWNDGPQNLICHHTRPPEGLRSGLLYDWTNASSSPAFLLSS